MEDVFFEEVFLRAAFFPPRRAVEVALPAFFLLVRFFVAMVVSFGFLSGVFAAEVLVELHEAHRLIGPEDAGEALDLLAVERAEQTADARVARERASQAVGGGGGPWTLDPGLWTRRGSGYGSWTRV